MKVECAYDELVELHKLQPNPRNPNKHPEKQIEMLAKIIDYQGQRAPIVVSTRSGFVTKGHGRLAALQKLGWEKAAVDFQEYDSEAQEHADMIADNKIAELADSDPLMINELALEMPEGFDFELLGIEDFNPIETNVLNEELEDEAPAVPKDTIIKLGDVIELGNHRLMCGDSTSIDAVEKLMNGEKADMVFTDPPYNHASDEKLIAQSVSKSMKNLSNSNWDKDFDIKTVLGSIDSAKSENSSVYICTSWHLAGDIWAWMKEHSDYSGYCVWSKNNPMPSLMKRHWTWSSELICYATYGKHTFNFPLDGHAKSVWEFNKSAKNDLHPTMKPVVIPEHAIAHSSKTGQNVLDLFGGSGSTLIACEKTNRKCFMMELDPHYCDVIVSRWLKYTNKTKIKLNGEMTDWKLNG